MAVMSDGGGKSLPMHDCFVMAESGVIMIHGTSAGEADAVPDMGNVGLSLSRRAILSSVGRRSRSAAKAT